MFPITRRSFGFFSVLLCVLLGGCGPRETPVQRGNREQVLLRGMGHDLADLDPHLATQASDYNVLSALFEGLVAEDPIDLHPVPGAAARWDVSPDGLVYTFYLQPEGRWSSGDPVTAPDFVASFRRVLSPALGAENAYMLYVVAGAEEYHQGRLADFSKVGFAALNARTLRITLARPTPYFLAALNHTIWFPVHMPTVESQGSATQRGNPWARPGSFVGNGPFVLKEWRTNQRIVVTRSPTYWDAAAVRLKGIQFQPLEANAAERAFRAGQLHLTEALPPSKIDSYRNAQPGNLRIDPLLGTYFYRCNTGCPGLGDPRVRRALAMAVDRQAIVEKILRGGQMPAGAFTPPVMEGYTPPAGISFDPAAARQLLADAGYPGGKGLPAFEILFNAVDVHRAVAEAVQEMWRRELGVETRLAQMDNTSVLAARRTGSYQILRSEWTADFIDPQNFLAIWASGSGNNFTGWADPAYDELMRQAALAPDNARRFGLLRDAEARLLDSAPFIPLFHHAHIFLIQPSVKGWRPTLLDHHPYKHVWLE